MGQLCRSVTFGISILTDRIFGRLGFNGENGRFAVFCYRIEYENGIPTALTLIDDDIFDNK